MLGSAPPAGLPLRLLLRDPLRSLPLPVLAVALLPLLPPALAPGARFDAFAAPLKNGCASSRPMAPSEAPPPSFQHSSTKLREEE
jgi:hypothetical protein